MAIIIDSAAPVFNTEQVHKGDLIRARHQTWDKPRNGVVVSVTATKIIVLYYAGFGNVSTHFSMLASEVSRGEWIGMVTTDMKTLTDICTEGGGKA